jgi:hypothetical protein
LPSAKAKPISVSMNNCKQVHGSSLGFFGGFCSCKEKSNHK